MLLLENTEMNFAFYRSFKILPVICGQNFSSLNVKRQRWVFCIVRADSVKLVVPESRALSPWICIITYNSGLAFPVERLADSGLLWPRTLNSKRRGVVRVLEFDVRRKILNTGTLHCLKNVCKISVLCPCDLRSIQQECELVPLNVSCVFPLQSVWIWVKYASHRGSVKFDEGREF